MHPDISYCLPEAYPHDCKENHADKPVIGKDLEPVVMCIIEAYVESGIGAVPEKELYRISFLLEMIPICRIKSIAS